MNDTNGTHLLYREPVRIRQQDQMLMGIRLQAHPTSQQKLVLSQWMGCARFIWNAKCDEDRYPGSYAHRYMPCGTYAPIGQKFSQYKDGQLSPWLSQCPSQIPRNSVVNWYQTYQKFLKGECGKPKRKKSQTVAAFTSQKKSSDSKHAQTVLPGCSLVPKPIISAIFQSRITVHTEYW